MWRVIRLERTRLARRIGRRGLLLILSGLSWAFLGLDIVTHTFRRFTNVHNAHPNLVLRVMENHWWGLLWMSCGLLAVFFGFARSQRIFRTHDAIGFNAILTPPFVWLLFSGWSTLASVFTHGRQGRDGEALYSVVVWLLVSLFIIVVAGWPEPTEALVRGRPDDDDDGPPR
jgi:hypothetical protein